MSLVFSGHQPNFLPYLGYFYKIFKSDIFVLDDDVQFSSKEYHNFNFIKNNRQKQKITVPISYNFGDKINEVKICYNQDWRRKMLTSLRYSYGKATHFAEVYAFVEDAFNQKFEYLVDLNTYLIKGILRKMGIDTKIVIASKDVPTTLTNNDRNVYQCEKLGCDIYYSGIGGKDYNDEKAYNDKGIRIVYSDYEPLKYKQYDYCFIENLSIIDYLMENGFVIPKEWK